MEGIQVSRNADNIDKLKKRVDVLEGLVTKLIDQHNVMVEYAQEVIKEQQKSANRN